MNKRYGWLFGAGSVLSKLTVGLFVLVGLSSASVVAQTNGGCFRAPAGLTGWWPLDGNSDPLIGLNSGVPIGDPFPIAGQVGGGLYFDGVDDGLRIQSPPRPGTAGFTAECWIWPWSFGVHQPILAWISPDGRPSVTLALGDPQLGRNDSLWTGFRGLDDITRSFVIPSGLVVTGVWQHVALVYTRGASNAAIFLNGSQVGSGYVGMPIFQTTQPHELRVANYSGTNGPLPSGYYGGIDEIAFYDRILTSNQIVSIFQAGAAGKCKDMLPPVVVAQPQSQSVPPGGTAVFSVVAQGTEPLLYRWRRNGITLSNAPNTPTLVLSNVSVANAGTYSVVITNGFGLTISSNAQLAIVTNSLPPAIVSFAPSNLTVQAGFNAQFTVVASGSPPLSYRWEFNGVTIPGRTNASLLLAAVTPAQTGSYQCFVSNPAGTTASPVGSLVVVDGPGDLPVIVTQPQDQSVPQGGDAVFSVVATGTPPLSYQWHFLGAPIPGATSNVLVISNVQPGQAGSYHVVVLNPSGAVTSSVASLNLILPPTITVQPQNRSTPVGSTAGFSLSIAGTPPFAIQWYFNGAALPGATNNPLVLSGVTSAQAGIYFARVANAAGETFSSNAVLTVFSCTRLTTAHSYSSWWPFDGSADDLAKTNSGVLLGNPSFGAGFVGQALELDGIDDSVLIPASPTLVAANVGTTNDGFTIEGWIRPADVTRPQPIFAWQSPLGGAGPQLWLAGSQGGSPGGLTAEFPDGGGQLQVLSTPGGLIQTGAWQHVALTYHRFSLSGIYVNGNSITQRFVSSSISQTMPPYQLRLGGLEGGPTFGGGLDEVQIFGRVLSAAQINAIYLAGDSGKCKDALPPTMIVHPAPQTVNAGESVILRAFAKGTDPLVYRWRRGAVTVAFGPELFIPSASISNAGVYSVTVSNNFGFATSSNAAVTVIGTSNSVPPSITSLLPLSLTVTQGATATFTVVASGTAPLSYQWLFNGMALTGRVSSVLSLMDVQPSQAGAYSVVVANSAGTVTSPPATLSVVPPASFGQLFGHNQVWKYDDTGADLGTAWRAPGYNDSAWLSGSGLLGVETSIPFPYPAPLLTPLSLGSNRVTYYFRTTFNFSGDPSAVSLVSTSFVDDGAVFYLNGSEVSRLRVPPGQSFNTLASAGPVVEGTPEVAIFATTNLFNGVNTLAVEVHQSSIASSDVVFGMNLIAATNAPPPPGAPVIVSQPQNRSVALGSTTFFSVVATGASPLSYQWFFNGNPVAGSISNTLTVVNVGTNSVGSYFAVVSNPFGSATSAVATLTLAPPGTNDLAPRIVSPTVVVTSNLLVGSAVSFRVVASGLAPLSYQWYRNGTPVSGTNGDTLFLSNVQFGQEGTYYAVVRNSLGAATNRGFILNLSDGQAGGLINFSLLGSSNAVVFETGTNLVPAGPTYLAQLYAGMTPDTLHAVGAAVPFNVPGRFSGGTRTITFIGSEMPVSVQVRVWASAQGPTFEEARANRGRIGMSGVTQIIPKFPPNAPAPLTGLSSFTLSRAPIVLSQFVTVDQGGSVAITLNATDPDGDPLSFTLGAPAHGALSGTPPNVLYTPTPSYFGPDGFSFSVSDGALVVSGNVIIMVRPVPPPIARFSVSPLAVLSADQTSQLVISPNNSNALVTLDASLSSPATGAQFAWFVGGSPFQFAMGMIVTNEFPVGEQLVTLAVTAGTLSSTASQAFEVITAAEAVDLLIELVSNSNLDRRVKRPLLSTLRSSSSNFAQGDFVVGVSQLHAFCNKVRSQIEPGDPALAATLITACRAIESVFEH